jgi:bisphosphoglycerate-independent phosphoglycerate mutase (AlkP superfamily)
LLEENLHRWRGDHIVDPESVPGILFMNRVPAQLQGQGPARIIDLSPTILTYLDVTVPGCMDGKSLL